MLSKKPKNKNLRNILISPFSNKYYTTKSNSEQLSEIKEVLLKLLPLAKVEKKSLKRVHKGKEDENHDTTSSSTKQSNILRAHLAPGFQSVVRELEKGELCSVLMEEDLTPPMIPGVICHYCQNHSVPLTIVPQLKSITKSALGFSTMVLGLKKSVDSPENQFLPILEMALKNKSTLKSPFDLGKSKGIKEEEERCEVVTNKTFQQPSTKDVYLYRSKVNERMFRPGRAANARDVKDDVDQLPKHSFDADFISFNNQSELKSLEHSRADISKLPFEGDIDKDDSDCGSLGEDDFFYDDSQPSMDEDNLFFIDSQPDHKLIDSDPSFGDQMDAETCEATNKSNNKLANTQSENKTSNKPKKYVQRYFTDTKQTKSSKKSKSKKKKNRKLKVGAKSINTEGHNQPAYSPMTLKTILSNPKKIKRKK